MVVVCGDISADEDVVSVNGVLVHGSDLLL